MTTTTGATSSTGKDGNSSNCTATTGNRPTMTEKERFRLPLQSLRLVEMQSWIPKHLVTTYEVTIQSNGREDLLRFRETFVGRCISTYPRNIAMGTREGDPICDMFSVRLYENRIVAAVADGCGWGQASALAARTAVRSFNSYIKSRRHALVSVRATAQLILDAFCACHLDVCKAKTEQGEVGTTTLAGGVLLTLQEQGLLKPSSAPELNALALSPIRMTTDQDDDGEESNSKKLKYAFVFASVGDVKVFHFSSTTGTLRDITLGETKTSVKKFRTEDCGGRIGPQTEDPVCSADLRNLACFAVPCDEGDIILMMSDGVADNLDPEILGLEPSGGGEWAGVADNERTAAKTEWRTSFLKTALVDCLYDLVAFTRHVLSFCNDKTRESRLFMETNPTKRLPKDYKLYSGKMDHTTLCCFRVGPVKLNM